MEKHWIIKKAPEQRGSRLGKVSTNDSGNNCYPSEGAAIKQAEKLAENIACPQYVVYESVQLVGARIPRIVTSPIVARPYHEDNTTCEDELCPNVPCRKIQNRYRCKENNCEDTECQRCFPTNRRGT